MNKFKDYFSEKPACYASYRPDYPDALFEYLAGQCQGHLLAWDCATGNGQAASKLAGYFDRVIATDASQKQIEQARPVKKVEYRVAPAEHSGLQGKTVDLVCVAQALHWFDLESFFIELQRVVKPAGLFAAWTYNLLKISPAIDEIIDHLYSNVFYAYWPEERRMVENGYADIDFSWREIATPKFSMSHQWDLNQLLGYLSTWSAFRQYVKQHSGDSLREVSILLKNEWPDEDELKTVKWPLTMRLWQK